MYRNYLKYIIFLNISFYSLRDFLRYKKYGSFGKNLKILMENKIFYFVTYDVE